MRSTDSAWARVALACCRADHSDYKDSKESQPRAAQMRKSRRAPLAADNVAADSKSHTTHTTQPRRADAHTHTHPLARTTRKHERTRSWAPRTSCASACRNARARSLGPASASADESAPSAARAACRRCGRSPGLVGRASLGEESVRSVVSAASAAEWSPSCEHCAVGAARRNEAAPGNAAPRVGVPFSRGVCGRWNASS